MRDTLATLFVGAMIGLLTLSFFINQSQTSFYNIVTKAIEECEKDLPRSQHCKMIAIPVDKD